MEYIFNLYLTYSNNFKIWNSIFESNFYLFIYVYIIVVKNKNKINKIK